VRIGLLLCDHLDPDVVERVGDYTELYPAAFGPVGIELEVYEVTRGEFPGRLDGCDGWITSGSRRSCYEDEPWIERLGVVARELHQERRPHVGICFGHQLIARALGGEVAAAPGGWGVGAQTFRVTEPARWMVPPAAEFTVLMSHRDQVTGLPAGARVLARADYCPVGAYRIDDHVFCLQGHPEFVPELSRLLLQGRRSTIGETVADEGLASLENRLDHDLIVEWIAEFFRN
jgi:GMP synthase-like glutamine amidotransferase